MTTEFDADTSKWLVKVVGEGLRDTAESGDMSDLQINEVSQTVRSHTDTMAVFEITEVQDLNSLDVNLFFPVGLPKGHDLIKAGVTLEPKLMSISPNVGTVASTLITATVPGIGKGTTGLNLVLADGKSLCRSSTIEVVEYGKLQCWSEFNLDYAEPQTVTLKHGENSHECLNADSTKCGYKADSADDTWPKILSLAISGNTLVYTGANFYTAGYSATASYAGYEATSVVVDSDT